MKMSPLVLSIMKVIGLSGYVIYLVEKSTAVFRLILVYYMGMHF